MNEETAVNNQNEEKEYVTFTIETMAGGTAELAVLYEFEYEKKVYVAAGLVEGDTINTDGVYIYRAKETEDGFKAEKITNHVEYERVAKAYAEMIEEEQ